MTEWQQNLPTDEYSPLVQGSADKRIGAILAADGKLGSLEIDRILELQRKRRLRFGEAAVRLGFIKVNDLRDAMATQYDLPHLRHDNGRLNSELVVAYEPFHRCAEQIRALRAQLLMRWARDQHASRSLAVVSPGPGEGRTYLAANLAVAFAQLGERTLLIDADMRRSRLHRIFDVPDRVGLSSILSRRATLEAIVPIHELGLLSLLPAGAPPPNPVELLSRDGFSSLLREVRTKFDVVVFDTPAATVSADAQTVAFRAGTALLLARRDTTRLTDANALVQTLANASVDTLGAVVNSY